MTTSAPEELTALQWYRCSCGFSGERQGTRTETIHWLVWGHLRHKGEDHKMVVKTLPATCKVVEPTSPSCMWCDRRDVSFDPSNDMFVCPDHLQKGPTR